MTSAAHERTDLTSKNLEQTETSKQNGKTKLVYDSQQFDEAVLI